MSVCHRSLCHRSLWLSVIENPEVGLGQPRHWISALVGDRHIGQHPLWHARRRGASRKDLWSILKSILVEGIMSVLANIKTREVVDEDLVAK
jgi:hypothetical protein